MASLKVHVRQHFELPHTRFYSRKISFNNITEIIRIGCRLSMAQQEVRNLDHKSPKIFSCISLQHPVRAPTAQG